MVSLAYGALYWQCITKVFLWGFLEIWFKAIRSWQHCRHFGRLLILVYFSQRNKENLYCAMKVVSCDTDIPSKAFEKKQFKPIDCWQTCILSLVRFSSYCHYLLRCLMQRVKKHRIALTIENCLMSAAAEHALTTTMSLTGTMPQSLTTIHTPPNVACWSHGI